MSKCPECNGERYFYFGAPDAEKTEAVKCDYCNGLGKVFDDDKLADFVDSQRQAYEFQCMADAELGRL